MPFFWFAPKCIIGHLFIWEVMEILLSGNSGQEKSGNFTSDLEWEPRHCFYMITVVAPFQLPATRHPEEMDREPQKPSESETKKSPPPAGTASLPSQANGNPGATPAHTAVTTFHTMPMTTERKIVQVIQQTTRQPRGPAAQLLHHMYTAQQKQQQQQQKHGSLQAAAQQQQQQRQSHLPSAQQASLFSDKTAASSPSSSTTDRVAVASSHQSPVTLTSSAVSTLTTTQSSSPGTASPRISPHALLQGKGTCTSQAQMLLRAQMLILTSAVRPELSVLSSSSRFASPQLQSLTLRPPPPGTLTIPPNLPVKSTVLSKPQGSSQPRAPTFPLRLNPPPSAKGKEASKGGNGPNSPQAGSKTAPVRHLSVPPASFYNPVQSHALAKHKLSSTGNLKRSHSQISPQKQPSAPRLTPSSSPHATPKKSLLELQRCPATLTQQAQTSSPSPAPALAMDRPQHNASTLTLPLNPSCATERSLLATKQLLKIALSSPTVKHASNQSANAVSPPRDRIHHKTLASLFPHPAKSESPGKIVQKIPVQQNMQLSPSSSQVPSIPAASPKVTSPLPSPQRPCPPSPALPLGAPSSFQKLPDSPVTPHGQSSPTEQKFGVEMEANGVEKEKLQIDLKKITEGKHETVTISSTEDTAMDYTMRGSRSKEPVKTPSPLDPVQPTITNTLSAHTDHHSAAHSHAMDTSPAQSCVIQPSNGPTMSNGPPTVISPSLDKNLGQSPPSSFSSAVEEQHKAGTAKPVILTHLVEGFIIQEGLEPFPVSRSSLMVASVKESEEEGVNGHKGEELLSLVDSAGSQDNSSDSDAGDTVPDNEFEERQNDMLQCEFCRKKGHPRTFLRSRRFCSNSCAKRFSYAQRFRTLRHSGSQEGQQSPDQASETQCSPMGHWRIHQPQEGEEDAPSPMRTRLRRYTEQERKRELITRESSDGARRDAYSTSDPVSSPDQSSRPKPAGWSVDQVWEFISTLPGCQEIAESFRAQEIDGQALLLLTEDHLMSAMNIKLGPALKICARINSLKEP
ncbi:polyhomeotic-like protein 3 isoform X3 [Denticeps clupeoides]|uniref:Polyhomeotic-like protein 3 n=1 Tax=Denticeps clupeoides TaxID=299321 RepID=A0AAY4EZD9_9TELE|nr:polyhomeotic-like protein 3 isoform X3 [Denticeps clupeoides]